MPKILAYTDGACSGNPGPGGWGALRRAKDGDTIVKERELSGGEAQTTNNRMELLAAINALESLSRASNITVVTDNRRQKAGQERRPLATAGRGAKAPHRHLGMGQGPRRPPGKRTRR